MKLFVLAAVTASFGVFGVAAWDAARDISPAKDKSLAKDLSRAIASIPEKAANPVPAPSEIRFSKAEFASAASASDWTMRTRDYQDLMFSAHSMLTPLMGQPQGRSDAAGGRVERDETVTTVPAGAPVKAATERAKPLVQAKSAPEQARPAPADKDALLMTPGRISRIKDALRLTADQEMHWPPIETALREIGRQQLDAQKRGHKLPKDALSPEVTQQLYWSAGPLIMSLRPDQKNEARSLARSMGLERVASLL